MGKGTLNVCSRMDWAEPRNVARIAAWQAPPSRLLFELTQVLEQGCGGGVIAVSLGLAHLVQDALALTLAVAALQLGDGSRSTP